MKILLVCSAGMSTSIVVAKMKEAVPADKKEDYSIRAISMDLFTDFYENYDVILLGPQIRFKLGHFKKILNGSKPIAVIDSVDYAMGNGKNVLKCAEELLMKGEE